MTNPDLGMIIHQSPELLIGNRFSPLSLVGEEFPDQVLCKISAPAAGWSLESIQQELVGLEVPADTFAIYLGQVLIYYLPAQRTATLKNNTG